MNIISLRHVTKVYGDNTVVDDLSLDVREGEIVALLGQTGAGKSTVLNMIMGQISPTRGEVFVQGLDPKNNGEALRGKVAVSFQTDRLLPWRDAQQNVALGLEYLGASRHERDARATEWLERVKLSDIHHRKFPHQLSGGMRQRVSLARALCVDPALVLLDESFSQLDHNTSAALRSDFVSLVRQLKKTCLLITHRIDDAVDMADRVVVLGMPAKIKLELKIDHQPDDFDWREKVSSQIRSELSDDGILPDTDAEMPSTLVQKHHGG